MKELKIQSLSTALGCPLFHPLVSFDSQLDLESVEEVLSNYRSCHGALIQWIEETTAQQERMKPGQAEDSRVLSEQLSQQMVGVTRGCKEKPQEGGKELGLSSLND